MLYFVIMSITHVSLPHRCPIRTILSARISGMPYVTFTPERTWTYKFYLLATIKVSVRSFTKSMHHKGMATHGENYSFTNFFSPTLEGCQIANIFFANVVYSGIRQSFPLPTFRAIR